MENRETMMSRVDEAFQPARDPVPLPGLASLDLISKSLLVAAVIVQIGSLSEPFIFVTESGVVWNVWLPLNIVTAVLAIAGGIFRASCMSSSNPRSALPWSPRTVTIMFWLCVICLALGLVEYVAFAFYYMFVNDPVLTGLFFSWIGRVGAIVVLSIIMFPPLLTHGLGAGFFYRRAQELRLAASPPANGYTDVEMQTL